MRRIAATPRRRITLSLEALEDRLAPAVFNVTTTADTHAVNLTTGLDANGQVSLRSALEAANNLGGSNTINLPAGDYKLTLGGNLNIDNDLTITGAGSNLLGTNSTIDAGNVDRIFQVSTGQVTTISEVLLQNGQTSTQGGAIYNAGTLNLANDYFWNDEVLGATGSDAEGGDIFNANGNSILKLTNTAMFGAAKGGNGSAGVDSLTQGTDGGNGGQALGGCIYNDGGEVSISGSGTINGTALGGQGGRGDNGGKGNPTGGNGGNGGASGAGGEALGGSIYNETGLVTITGCSMADQLGEATAAAAVAAKAAQKAASAAMP